MKELRAKRKAFVKKYNLFCKKMTGTRQERAAKLIAKRWREYALNKERKHAATAA